MKLPSSKLLLALSICLATVVSTACRHDKRRAVRTASPAVTLHFVNNGGDFQRESADAKQKWVYEISGCMPATSGTYLGPQDGKNWVDRSSFDNEELPAVDVVAFESAAIHEDLSDCQIRVQTLGGGDPAEAGAAGIQTPFEDRVLYWQKGLDLQQLADGTYLIRTTLQRTYYAQDE